MLMWSETGFPECFKSQTALPGFPLVPPQPSSQSHEANIVSLGPLPGKGYM